MIGGRQQEGGAMRRVGSRQNRVPFLLLEHRTWKVLVLGLPHDRFHSVFQLQLAFLERGFFEQFGFG